MKFDITIYGHLFIDRIYEGQYKKNSLGGLANSWKALLQIDSSLSINVHPLSIGESLVYVNKNNNERVFSAVFNKDVLPFKNYSSEIYHIAYLDNLQDTSFLKQLKGLVFADCSSEKFDINLLKYIDYFFISEDDAKHDVSFYGKLTKKGAILHYPSGSLYSNGKKTIEFYVPKNKYFKNVNVLGAGDMFASSVIYGIYKNNSINNAIKNAHILTSKLIKTQNEGEFSL